MHEIGRLARLELGYVGETNSRVIEIDVSEWLERWPDAIIVAWHERPDKYGYWANTSEEDGILSWTIHSGDVAVAGEGFLQVRAIMPKGDGKIYKSRVVRTRTYASLEEWMNDPDAPDPMEAWANVAAVARAEAVAARDAAEQHAYNAEESATMAEVAKDATLSYQDATYIYMGRAERAAESADQAKETTAQIAAAAGESANIATESATAAIKSKIEALEAAEQASEDADTAAAAKKTAVEAAEQAKVSEENSRKTASDASRGMANNNVIMDALVPYWGDNAVIEIGRPNYPAENIGVVRNGGTVVLNGTASAMVRITMSGDLAVTATNADFEALERTVDFFDGRVYELELRNLSGTMTGDDLRCIVYKEGVEDPVGYAVYNPSVGKGVTRFTWDGVGSDGIVALRVPAGMAFEDCEMCVVITDVAARAEATADATAREGVAANVQSIKDLKAKQQENYADVTTMIASVADDVTPRVIEADRVTKNTDGHFWPILWTAVTKITTYTETDGVITEHADKPLGSEIIPCPRNLFFDFENGTARIYLYFYTKNDDESFTPNWDIVNLTASTGLKNYINSGQYGKTAIRDIPDGMYMQAAVPVGNVQLYGWDGEAFGPPLTTNANTVTSSGNTNSMMADGNGSVIIPGDAQYVITTDPKATLRMGIGVKDGVSTYLGSSATEFIKLPTGYDYLMYRLDPNSGIKTTWTGDASKYVAAVCDMQRNRLTETAAKFVIDAARKISEFQWTPAANIRIQGGGKEYYPGVTYNGIPYGSGWQVAHYVGWHVSAHTYLNAVADDASIMVMEGLADDGNAPYYSTVCSAFATMAAGWPHPALNDEMAINPKVKLIRTVTPPIGVVWSNIGKGGGKHCVIPERVDYIGDKVESISAYEGVPAATMRTTRYSNITDTEDKTRFKQAYGANYYDTYGAAAYHLEAVRDMSNIPYWDADTATVTGGDARPYRGDRSVYTSQMDSVLINIKNANAESLLLRNPSGGTHLIPINGATQIDVKSYMSEDGIYYVSTDTSFTEESFEYVSTEPLTYKSVNGQISFDRNDWWYVYVEFTPDRRNSYWPEKTKMVNVPCNADNDYRDWTAIGRFGKAYVAYYKGQYGAYTVPCVATEIWDDGVDDLVDKFRVGTGLSMEGRTLNAEVTQTDIEELRMIINQGGGSGGGSGGIVTETDPTVPARISAHNTSEDAHNDIRLLLADLDKRLVTLADSDDTTLDQLSEIVAYIKSNKSLIDGITTGKISTADIVDNLTTNAANKPLSAAQGVALKKLIDAIVVPTKVSAFENDVGYAKQEELAELSKEIDTLGSTSTDHESRLKTLEANSSGSGSSSDSVVPDYWLDELETKADAIQQAMEKAGRKKSAFLWYTDAHWPNGNSKVSPVLLDYLHRHTPMTKVNFGGDIIGDSLLASRADMTYLYEWREAIRGLPNHHSVSGNHDMFESDSVDYEDDNYRYAFLIAPEETPDMVVGDGLYYYIDNPAEKTRYLYIAFPNTVQEDLKAQTAFIASALKSTSEGWHIVAIAHRWWQYTSSSAPTTGKIAPFEADILAVFDAYNARETRAGSNYFTAQDFTDAKGKVEFCIGGHIHVDHDFESDGGIPIIITTADANQNRVPDSTVDSGTLGTTTEAAVFGIIADYNDTDNTKITVVGVGRGTSRVVRKSDVKPTSLSGITYSGDTTVGAAIDKSKFSFTVNYSNGTTDTVNGATSVTPATIAAVGDNTVTVNYTEGTTTLSGTVTIVGTAVPVANLFDATDADVTDRGRINSSGAAVAYADGMLVTGYIAAKPGDVLTITTDAANTLNSYTGNIGCYKSDKTFINTMTRSHTTNVVTSADALTLTVTIPNGVLNNKDYSATEYVRFCVAYTDINSIVITKS